MLARALCHTNEPPLSTCSDPASVCADAMRGRARPAQSPRSSARYCGAERSDRQGASKGGARVGCCRGAEITEKELREKPRQVEEHGKKELKLKSEKPEKLRLQCQGKKVQPNAFEIQAVMHWKS
ncbi:hypothetical protein NDU88_004500 [Pleurodeles waltl]|uniref:Uncharacterized protein n=1 Tax=Pleurodeles waltl TaxID=8319 RepID=A0AAV7QGD2_PLEWA|nr:hypothetical protein NDU88_004500 [Pleurodeles waltl]